MNASAKIRLMNVSSAVYVTHIVAIFSASETMAMLLDRMNERQSRTGIGTLRYSHSVLSVSAQDAVDGHSETH
jgi:hypothetical protein